MTENSKKKLDEFKNKLWWFVIPSLLTFFTWMTISVYQIRSDVEVGRTERTERAIVMNKIWEKVEANYNVLHNYEIKNEEDHQKILEKVNDLKIQVTEVETKVDKIYRLNQSTYYIPYKDTSFLWTRDITETYIGKK